MCSVKPLKASPGFWMRELTTRRSSPCSPARSSNRRSKSRSLRSCSTLIQSIAPERSTPRVAVAAPAGLVLGVLFGDEPEDPGRAFRLEDRLAQPRLLEEPRDPRQRFQVHPRRILRREQHEEEVRRLPVDGGEVHSGPLAPEGGQEAGNARQLAVRDRHPLADAGRPELLALEQRLGQLGRGEAGLAAGEAGAKLCA